MTANEQLNEIQKEIAIFESICVFTEPDDKYEEYHIPRDAWKGFIKKIESLYLEQKNEALEKKDKKIGRLK